MRRLRTALARLRAARGFDAVRLVHVRAHARIEGNELADRLAKYAAVHGTSDGDAAIDAAKSELSKQERDNAADTSPASPPQPHAHTQQTQHTRPQPQTPVMMHSLGVG